MPAGGYKPRGGRPLGSGGSGGATQAEDAPENFVEAPGGIQEKKDQTPLEYLISVMNDPKADPVRRDRAAGIAILYCHPKADDIGKKGQREEAAAEAGKGKFATAPPPHPPPPAGRVVREGVVPKPPPPPPREGPLPGAKQ